MHRLRASWAGVRRPLRKTARWLVRRLRRSSIGRALAHPGLSEFQPEDDRYPAGEFSQLFQEHSGRVCHKWHHYFPIYDRELAPYRSGVAAPQGGRRPVRFLEIGVSKGGSLQLWRKYFAPEATIHGLDINPRCAELSTDDLPVHIGSQASPAVLRAVVEEMGGVDVVVDDGSHRSAHQRASFDELFDHLSDGGLYLIEDTHTSYWWDFEGGYRRPGTAIEMAKSLVDGIHKWYFRTPVSQRSSRAKTSVESVTFYDSVIAIRKGRRQRPVVSTTPTH